ncbi:MAG: GDSL-type esterase/lipase family protein [Steroidobacteraceae bacterium]
MKKLLLAFAAVTGLLFCVLAFERVFVERTVGPVALASLAVLAALSVTLFVMYRLYDSKYRNLINNMCLAGAVTVATYVLVDLAAGAILIQRLSPPLVPDEYRHHRMVPNSYSSFRQRDFEYIQRVNNFGMRGHDITAQKPPGTYRILMLGDSFTMGKGVEDQETFSVLVERALKDKLAACGGARTIEVLNGGVDSYAPILSYIALTRDFAALSPDMVVLNLDVSDLVQESAYRQIARRDASGEIIGVPQLHVEPSLTDRIRDWTNHHLFITRTLLYLMTARADDRTLSIRDVVEQANFAVAAHTLEGDTELRDQQWRNIFESIGRIKSFAESRNMKFVLTIYPWGHQVNDTEWMPGRRAFMPEGARPSEKSRQTVHEYSARMGIELVDLFPVFRAYRGKRPLYFDFDAHWTTTGQQVAAAGLESYLTRHQLEAWCRGPG